MQPGESGQTTYAIEDFLGSTHVFALALNNVLEAKLLREVAGGALTAVQIKVLKLIAQDQTRTIGDLAAFLGVSDPAASKTVDRLVRRGLVRRTEREADRRANELALTPAGQHLMTGYEEARRQRLEEVFREVPRDELEKTASLLSRVAASIVTHTASPEEVCLQCDVFLKERCLLQQVARRTCPYRKRAERRETGEDG